MTLPLPCHVQLRHHILSRLSTAAHGQRRVNAAQPGSATHASGTGQRARADTRLGRLLASLALGCSLALAANVAHANDAAVTAMAEYLEFQDYGGGVIFAEQMPADQWPKTFVIDARDAGQYSKGHIDGAVNIEWRHVLAEKGRIPKDKMVLIYCNTGSLSAQAGFALRVAGYDNVRILQGGYEEWKAKGGFDAASRAATAAPKH